MQAVAIKPEINTHKSTESKTDKQKDTTIDRQTWARLGGAELRHGAVQERNLVEKVHGVHGLESKVRGGYFSSF